MNKSILCLFFIMISQNYLYPADLARTPASVSCSLLKAPRQQKRRIQQLNGVNLHVEDPSLNSSSSSFSSNSSSSSSSTSDSYNDFDKSNNFIVKNPCDKIDLSEFQKEIRNELLPLAITAKLPIDLIKVIASYARSPEITVGQILLILDKNELHEKDITDMNQMLEDNLNIKGINKIFNKVVNKIVDVKRKLNLQNSMDCLQRAACNSKTLGEINKEKNGTIIVELKKIIARLLAMGADANGTDIHEYRLVPIAILAQTKYYDLVSLLLNYGADIENSNDLSKNRFFSLVEKDAKLKAIYDQHLHEKMMANFFNS